MRYTRRDFLFWVSACAFDLLVPENIFPSDEQKIIVNLPSYNLKLICSDKEIYDFPIAIGRGFAGRRETPVGEGIVDEKRDGVLFRYGKDYPQTHSKKGDVIRWTNTFDEKGNRRGYKMPYKNMRGLGLKIKEKSSKKIWDRFVIHSTTDEFTIGTPASNGCLRVGMNDMLKLYDLICPEIKKGYLEKPVGIEILYNLVELEKSNVIIHDDVYNKNINYVEEFKKLMSKKNLNENFLDYTEMEKSFETAKTSFKETRKKILETLMKEYPKNFVPVSLKEKLHKRYSLSEFFKN